MRFDQVLPFFFYGTLMDPDLRAAVLGQTLPPETEMSAYLPDYRRRMVVRCAYPSIVPTSGSKVEGKLVFGLNEHMAARISYYEGNDFEPVLLRVMIGNGDFSPAWVFRLKPHVNLGFTDWSLPRWRRSVKSSAIRAAEAEMTNANKAELRRHAIMWHSMPAADP